MSHNSISVNDLEIGARIVRKLREAGYVEVTQLTNDANDSWSKVLSAKEASQLAIALKPLINENLTRSARPKDSNKSSEVKRDDVAALPISRTLATRLRLLGFETISSVEDNLYELSKIKGGMSPSTVRGIKRAISEWRRDVPAPEALKPKKTPKRSTGKFVNWIPTKDLNEYADAADLIEDLISEALNFFGERDRAVLENRAFCRDQDSYQTLQSLAEQFGVTRERIRQIEKKRLANVRALILDCQPVKQAYPRTELKDFWFPLHERLSSLEEISVAELSSHVAAALDVPSEKLSRIVALLTPILTLSVADPLAAQAREGGRHLSATNLPAELRALPITYLRLGQSTKALVNKNVHTIEDYYSFCQVQRSGLGKKNKAVFDSLTTLNSRNLAKPEDPQLLLSEALGLHIDEFTWKDGLAGTYLNFVSWFSGVIGIVFTWSKVEDVFRLRTALPAGERMGLKELSIEISGNSNGGISGRVERYILDGMTAIFVHRDLSKCPIHIPSEVNELMDSLTSCFSESGDNFELFSTIICHRLNIPEVEVGKSSHLFWALLSGNLPNRYWHLQNRSANDTAVEEIELAQKDRVIKLRGFRSTY